MVWASQGPPLPHPLSGAGSLRVAGARKWRPVQCLPAAKKRHRSDRGRAGTAGDWRSDPLRRRRHSALPPLSSVRGSLRQSPHVVRAKCRRDASRFRWPVDADEAGGSAGPVDRLRAPRFGGPTRSLRNARAVRRFAQGPPAIIIGRSSGQTRLVNGSTTMGQWERTQTSSGPGGVRSARCRSPSAAVSSSIPSPFRDGSGLPWRGTPRSEAAARVRPPIGELGRS